MDDEFVVREKRILSILEQEVRDGEEMATTVRHIAEDILLSEKGYTPDDIQIDAAFDVVLPGERVRAQVDFLVTLDNQKAMVIKCAAGSLASRERHVVAAARIMADLPIPIAVVMDPMSAIVLDGITGKTLGEGVEAIPSKQQLRSMLDGIKIAPLSAEKLEREKRVFLAFDSISCCIPKGGDGGVHLDGPVK